MDVKWLFYVLYVTVVQSVVVMWTTKPYIEYRSGKRYGKILLLLLLIFHDYSWSVFGGQGQTVWLLAEVVCFYPLVFFTIRDCCKNAASHNLIYMLALEFALQMAATLITFPLCVLIYRFNMESTNGFGETPSLTNIVMCLIVNTIAAFIVAKIYGFLYRHMKAVWFELICIVFAFLDVFVLFISGWKAATVAILILSILLLWSYRQQNQYERQLKLQYAYYQSVESAQRQREKEIAEIRHDISNHLSVMEEMERDNLDREILQRIDRKDLCFTGIPVLDCLIREKEAVCLEKHISFKKQGILFRDISISEYDLVSLFANLLDNAIEAAEKTTHREISLMIQRQQGYLKISLTNTKPPQQSVKGEFQTTKADKKNHGIGNKIIKKIVSSYDGRVTFEEEEEKMAVLVILCL